MLYACACADILHLSMNRPLNRDSLIRASSISEQAMKAASGPLPDPESLPNVEPESLGICYRL